MIFDCSISPYHSSDRAFIGDCKGMIAKKIGTQDQLFSMRCSGKKRKVGLAKEFSIRHGLNLAKETMEKPLFVLVTKNP